MLLRSYIPALSIVHRAVALSCKNDARLDTHGLRSAREYISQIEVLALSGQENNNNDTITTLNQANSNATNVTAELHPRTRRVAELEARGVEFSTYLSWEDPEGCPPPLLQCTDCGGRMLSRHRDMVVPTTRCVGVSPSFRLDDSD